MTNNTVCYLTAYIEIGRSNWKYWQRSFDEYISAFLPYLNFDIEMIIYIDETHYERLYTLTKDKPRFKLIKINREFLNKNIFAWSVLDHEREIMQDQLFKSVIKHRINNPECSIPEYNIVRHSKIDFVNYAIDNNLSNANYYAWTDFGYFKKSQFVPKNQIDINKFDLTKINFSLINELEDIDRDTFYTLINAPEKIAGSFFFASKDLMKKYQLLYHDTLKEFYNNNIVDDDQHITLKCYYKCPSIFKLWNLKGWCKIWTEFQYNDTEFQYSDTAIHNKIKIAFFVNQLCERGAAIVVFDYAYYNMTYLKNDSIIIYFKNNHNNQNVINKCNGIFKTYGIDTFNDIDSILRNECCNLLYIIKSGQNDGKITRVCRTVVHCVFDCRETHGNVYAAVSDSIDGYNDTVPIVPHMINLPDCNENLRSQLNIPQNAIVFGRYGGYYMFDIDYVKKVVHNVAKNNPNIYFLFANTNKFCEDIPNIIHMSTIIDLTEKVKFINTCDAMLHGGSMGESFGLAIGEFSTKNKPVITTKGDRINHIKILKDKCLLYNNTSELTNILLNFDKTMIQQKDWNAYRDYTPENVMNIFKKVFIDNNSPIKIVDTFIFYNEIDMLKFRLIELNDYVDYFVLVEATHTFAGNPKKLYFNENKDIFAKYKDKIIHIVVGDIPNTTNASDRERHQRNCIKIGVDRLNLLEKDVIIISDVDEIPNTSLLDDIKKTGMFNGI